MTSEQDSNLTSHGDESFYDPAEYIKLYCSGSWPSELEKLLCTWTQDQIHKIFVGGKYKGKKLLDIGSGPVVYAVITASKYYDECYVSDLSPANVDFLQKWIREESTEMEYLMKEFSKKEGESGAWEVRKKQVREKIKNAVVSDLRKPNPVSGTILENTSFDAITACLCFSAAVLTIEDYTKAIQNCGKILKPGGHLVIVDIIDNSWYALGNMKFKTLATTEEEIRRAFSESGYEIEEWETYHLNVCPAKPACDATLMYSLVAKKL